MGSGEDAIFAPLQADGAYNKDYKVWGSMLGESRKTCETDPARSYRV